MRKYITAFICLVCLILIKFNSARIHHLSLHDDSREQITMSTYGFLKGGLLQMRAKIDFNPIIKLEAVSRSFAFILEKSNNNGFSSFSTDNNSGRSHCASKSFETDFTFENNPQKHKYSLILFELDLIKKYVKLRLIGDELSKLKIKSKLENPNGFGSFLSDEKNSNKTLTDTSSELRDDSEYAALDLSRQFIALHNVTNSSFIIKFEVNVEAYEQEGLYTVSFYNCFQKEKLTEENLRTKQTDKLPPKNDPLKSAISNMEESNSVRNLFDFKKIKNDLNFGINMELDLLERNQDTYLSAGEMPVPTLYLTWSIIYFLAGISWMYILRASKGDVFKIHYLMLALVFVKSISLTFHAINMHYIAVNGRHEAIWAILYYITYVLRGLLLIISILLVGTGWTFIKHILSENERRLFVIVIPLQILAITAYIFLEEKEEGDAVYVTWRQLFFLLDLLCCGAILFPVVWSIRHLERACASDGKMVTSLKKLKIFKHFYIMVIFYIYFTRIVGFLLKQMLPFRYEWFNELSMEVVTFTFFAFTAYKFQPASNNPYLQLNQEETEDLINNTTEMIHLSDDFNLNANDTDTVFDMVKYETKKSDQEEQQECLQPCGPDSVNPNLFSRNNKSNS